MAENTFNDTDLLSQQVEQRNRILDALDTLDALGDTDFTTREWSVYGLHDDGRIFRETSPRLSERSLLTEDQARARASELNSHHYPAVIEAHVQYRYVTPWVDADADV